MTILHEVEKNALYGNKDCPPVFLLPAISDHTVCRIFMKFGIYILYRILSNKFVFFVKIVSLSTILCFKA
jgi:hypothetical protein